MEDDSSCEDNFDEQSIVVRIVYIKDALEIAANIIFYSPKDFFVKTGDDLCVLISKHVSAISWPRFLPPHP